MLVLKDLMKQHGIEQTEVAAAAAVSQPAVSQLINHGIWPKRRPEEVRQKIMTFTASRGLGEELSRAFDEVLAAEPASTSVPQQANNEEDENMLLAKQVLNPVTKSNSAFSVTRSRMTPCRVQRTCSPRRIFATSARHCIRQPVLVDLWLLSGNPARGKAHCAVT